MKQQTLQQFLKPVQQAQQALTPIISQSPMLPVTPYHSKIFQKKSSNKKVHFDENLITSIKKSKLKWSTQKQNILNKENKENMSCNKSPQNVSKQLISSNSKIMNLLQSNGLQKSVNKSLLECFRGKFSSIKKKTYSSNKKKPLLLDLSLNDQNTIQKPTEQKTDNKSINETRFSSFEKDNFSQRKKEKKFFVDVESLEKDLNLKTKINDKDHADNEIKEKVEKKLDYKFPEKILNTIKQQYDNLQLQLQKIHNQTITPDQFTVMFKSLLDRVRYHSNPEIQKQVITFIKEKVFWDQTKPQMKMIDFNEKDFSTKPIQNKQFIKSYFRPKPRFTKSKKSCKNYKKTLEGKFKRIKKTVDQIIQIAENRKRNPKTILKSMKRSLTTINDKLNNLIEQKIKQKLEKLKNLELQEKNSQGQEGEEVNIEILIENYQEKSQIKRKRELINVGKVLFELEPEIKKKLKVELQREEKIKESS